jgi:hypothetical protein
MSSEYKGNGNTGVRHGFPVFNVIFTAALPAYHLFALLMRNYIMISLFPQHSRKINPTPMECLEGTTSEVFAKLGGVAFAG